jgi:hypothetical protein
LEPKQWRIFAAPMNAKNLIETLNQYLVSDVGGKKIFHLPETLALRINLSVLRGEFPQTILVMHSNDAFAELIIS